MDKKKRIRAILVVTNEKIPGFGGDKSDFFA